MLQQILQVDQAMLETTLDRMVRKSVEETLNAMLDAEADEITGATRYERSGERKAYRAGHYERDLTVKAGRMSLKEDAESWRSFIAGMLARGLKGVRLVTGDRCAGLVSAVGELLPGARYQRCMVHFERNILARADPKNRDWAADALKAVFSMETRDKALEKAESVAGEMESRKLREAAGCLREGIGEATTYLLDDYPREHRRRIRTNNMIERPDREIRRRTRVVGSFPDGRSALMPVCARIRYVTSDEWSTRRYLDMSRLGETVPAAN